MYGKIKIKKEIINRAMLLLILSSFLFIFIFNLFQKSLENPTSFKVKIIDKDDTETSADIVESIKLLDGVNISDTGADVEYIIKQGFEKKFLDGNFDGLIDVKKNSFKQGISLLNDRIATKLVSDYIYKNLYNRIRLENGMSFEEYNKTLAKTRLENEILFISLNDRKIENALNSEIEYSSYVKLFFMLLVGLSIGMKHIIKINRIRTNGILERLKLSGSKEEGVIFVELTSAMLKYIVFILPFFVLKNEIKLYVIAIVIFVLNMFVCCLTEKITKSEEVLMFMLRSIMILFLIIGIIVNFYF